MDGWMDGWMDRIFYFPTEFYQIKIYNILKFVLHKIRTRYYLSKTNYS